MSTIPLVPGLLATGSRSRPRARGRRRFLGLVGALPALAALGGCGPGPDDGPTDPPEDPGLAPGTCHEGAAVPRPSDGPSDGAGASDVAIDDSVLSATGLDVSPDGALLAANAGIGRKRQGQTDTAGTVLWDTADGSVAQRFDNELTGAIAWHPDGSLLAVGGREHIELTSPDGEVRWTLTGHGPAPSGRGTSTIRDLAFSADGSMLASLSTDGTVRLWTDIGSGCTPGAVLDVRSLRPLSLAVSPDAATLAVCGTEAPVELFDLPSAARDTAVEGTEFAPRAVAYAPDGTLLIGTGVPAESTVSSPERARLYAMPPSGQPRRAPDPLGLDVGSIAVGADGERIAVVGTGDNQVMVWDRSSDQRQDLPRVPGSAGTLAWAPDRTRLYGASPGEGVIAWDGTDWTSFDLP